jgi:hypothetical protein
MPKQWLSFPEAVELIGGEPETAQAKILEGGQAGEIAGRSRGPRGQVKAMTAHQWYWPINWERSELSVQQPVTPPSELDLLMRDRAPDNDLPALLEAELLIEQMTHGGVAVAHWFWARIEVERETLLRYVEPDPLLRPGPTTLGQPATFCGQPRTKEPEGLEAWFEERAKGPRSNREEDLEAARKQFGQWPNDFMRIRELRKQYTPLWTVRGRPKSGK